MKLIPSKILSLQARKPSGLLGRYLMTRLFNSGNADLNDFVFDMLELKKDDHVLEIGYGTGTLINQIANVLEKGIVEGVDFSKEMLKEAVKLNRKHTARDKVRLYKNDCKSLPFEDESFDKICSSNTIYFWEEPQEYLIEMLRVLKKDGKVVIGFRDKLQMSNLKLSNDVFNMYSKDDIIDILKKAGFFHVHIKEKEGIPFVSYCAIAHRV